LTFRELEFNQNPSNWRSLTAKEQKLKLTWRLEGKIRAAAIQSFKLNKGLFTCLCDKYLNAKFHNSDLKGLKIRLFMCYLSFSLKQLFKVQIKILLRDIL